MALPHASILVRGHANATGEPGDKHTKIHCGRADINSENATAAAVLRNERSEWMRHRYDKFFERRSLLRPATCKLHLISISKSLDFELHLLS